MRFISLSREKLARLLVGGLTLLAASEVISCTRFVYHGANGQVMTARSMDWKSEIVSNLWIYPRGMERTGETGSNTARWTSKYGSVTTSGYDISTTDGVNEVGLNANLLWLVESQYPKFTNDSKPGLTIAVWAQYMLDNFATVQEAVEVLKKEPFTIVTENVPGEERLATLHLSLSDASGDSAIVEYINGKQVIHHNRSYQVMTNSPIFSEQLAVEKYWKPIGGAVFLPGTNRAADRFARASFYVNAIPKDPDANKALASVFSVIRNVSVPYGIATPEQPNISSTRWRTVFDHQRQLYFFDSALTPNTFWVNLKKVDFDTKTGRVMKLDLGPNQNHTFSGEANQHFKPAKAFTFLGFSGR